MEKFNTPLRNAVIADYEKNIQHLKKVMNIANAIFTTIMVSGVVFACVVLPLMVK